METSALLSNAVLNPFAPAASKADVPPPRKPIFGWRMKATVMVAVGGLMFSTGVPTSQIASWWSGGMTTRPSAPVLTNVHHVGQSTSANLKPSSPSGIQGAQPAPGAHQGSSGLKTTTTGGSLPTSGEPTLQERIASFYDQTSQLWEEQWGEHMHHGLYQPGIRIESHDQNIEAQEHMIDEILTYGNAHDLKGELRILDAGCGIGGSARYLARKFPQAKVTGITLSPYQHQRAVALTAAAGLSDRVDFKVMDAMQTSFADNTFDLVYSMESGEHMPDKRGFVEECFRVLKPKAPLVMAVWCHREIPPELQPSETKLLQKIYKVYALPYVCPLSDFTMFAKDLGMQSVRHDDWTRYIKPFWWQVIKRALTPAGLWGIIKSGWTAIHAAWAAWWMHVAVERNVFVFGAFTAAKAA